MNAFFIHAAFLKFTSVLTSIMPFLPEQTSFKMYATLTEYQLG